ARPSAIRHGSELGESNPWHSPFRHLGFLLGLQGCAGRPHARGNNLWARCRHRGQPPHRTVGARLAPRKPEPTVTIATTGSTRQKPRSSWPHPLMTSQPPSGSTTGRGRSQGLADESERWATATRVGGRHLATSGCRKTSRVREVLLLFAKPPIRLPAR